MPKTGGKSMKYGAYDNASKRAPMKRMKKMKK